MLDAGGSTRQLVAWLLRNRHIGLFHTNVKLFFTRHKIIIIINEAATCIAEGRDTA